MTFETKINDRIKAARKEGEAYGEAIGEARGRAEGHAEGLVAGMISLVRENLISIEVAAEKSGLSVEEFTQKMNPATVCEDASKYGEK